MATEPIQGDPHAVGPNWQFIGDFVVAKRSAALATAEALLALYEPDCLVLFTDGSTRWNASKGQYRSGAAVVYRSDEAYERWKANLCRLDESSDAFLAELYAISEALAVGIDWAKGRQTEYSNGSEEDSVTAGDRPRVVVLTDSKSAIERIKNYLAFGKPDDRRFDRPLTSGLIGRSRTLHRLGVSLNIRWVPGHSSIEGNVKADAAARYAAESIVSDDGESLDPAEACSVTSCDFATLGLTGADVETCTRKVACGSRTDVRDELMASQTGPIGIDQKWVDTALRALSSVKKAPQGIGPSWVVAALQNLSSIYEKAVIKTEPTERLSTRRKRGQI